ncbi:unnamed protein product [Paramecium sonneborni]|uniref:Uncharacterized protein n=1 Tax=Paramecium sonneborni TaxID=65129 RepID=A0A8S1M7L7_9CILI|nr:unnamed protein product [Paramecium sonneborni]
MNQIIDKKESTKLDSIMIIKNLEYLKDHLVMDNIDKISQDVELEEDLDKTILICNSDYDY